MFGINTNISALNAGSKLNASVVEQSTTMKRLATGLRVNFARDDAASLAISTGLVSQIRGMAQAVKNVSDGISLAQTAESALENVIVQLQKLRELTVQSGNGTLNDTNINTLQNQQNQVISGINEILKNTNFNSIKLFDGSTSNVFISVGENNASNTIKLDKIDSFILKLENIEDNTTINLDNGPVKYSKILHLISANKKPNWDILSNKITQISSFDSLSMNLSDMSSVYQWMAIIYFHLTFILGRNLIFFRVIIQKKLIRNYSGSRAVSSRA